MDKEKFRELVALKKGRIARAIELLKKTSEPDKEALPGVRVPVRLRKIIESGDGISVGWVSSYGPICNSSKKRLRYIEQLDDAEKWLEMRIAGIERHIAEIKRQTQHKEDMLEREYAMAKLQQDK